MRIMPGAGPACKNQGQVVTSTAQPSAWVACGGDLRPEPRNTMNAPRDYFTPPGLCTAGARPVLPDVTKGKSGIV